MQPIEKVTAFVIRDTESGPELLLFQHPFTGIQLPAGTVDSGEDFADAAVREAFEETGLNARLVKLLGVQVRDLGDSHRITLEDVQVYARPDVKSFNWAFIRHGIFVQYLRSAGEFAQIKYEENDHSDHPNYVTFCIQGWVDETRITRTERRHFYLLGYDDSTPDRWQIHTDNHTFELFWAPIDALPAIHIHQQPWLSYLQSAYPQAGMRAE